MNALDVATRTLWILAPETLLVVGAVVMLTTAAFVRPRREVWCLTALVLHALAFVAVLVVGGAETDPYASPVVNDALAHFGRLGLALTGAMFLALGHDQIDDDRAGEFFGAVTLTTAGAMLACTANELVLLFLGLELISVPTYFLLFLSRRNSEAREAATKYFLLSLLASAFLLFGLAYLYGLTGTSQLKAMAYLLANVPEATPEGSRQFALIALVFVAAGLSFRLAAVPLHFYAPDVYQGAPTILTAMLAWVPKVVGMVALIRILACVLPPSLADAGLQLMWVLAASTLILGNAMALLQNNLKRLLAYSSIAQAGFLLVGAAAAFADGRSVESGEVLGTEAIVLYLAAYAPMTIGAFAAILALRSRTGREIETVDDLSGLAQTRPGIAACLALCLLSLAGIPPLFGFWGKFLIFEAAVSAAGKTGQTSLYWLAAIGAVNAAIGAYYYLRPIVFMYLRQPREGATFGGFTPQPTWVVLVLCATISGLFGLAPGLVGRPARRAAIEAVELPAARAPETRIAAVVVDEPLPSR